MSAVEILYFSDILCVWAYVAQARVDAVAEKFGEAVRIEHRFCSVFGDTAQKIPLAWKERGSYDGFNAHLHETARRFPHIEIHPDVWKTTRPASSTSPHLFLKALQLSPQAEGKDGAVLFDRTVRELRLAFFMHCRDIARWETQCDVARKCGADVAAIEARIHDGTAHAALASDYQDADKMKIEGSPSLVLNSGRQKLYGNVGFHLIEANIRELMRAPRDGDASWC